jgi:hypothetical protein
MFLKMADEYLKILAEIRIKHLIQENEINIKYFLDSTFIQLYFLLFLSKYSFKPNFSSISIN